LNPDAGPYVVITQGDQTQLNGTGGGNGTYSWAPATGLSCTNCPDPVASPTVTTTYTLTVADSLGCMFTDTVTVAVELNCGLGIFVPNAFSPNGDGQNDVLYVRGDCIEFMEFSVFNRWGEEVFHSTSPAQGWNGVWRGEPCEDAIFTYVVHATMYDGTQQDAKGNVALIK